MSTPAIYDDWYSDDALAKQRKADEDLAAGRPFDLADLCGILEPRVPPTADEKCRHCGSDAREYVGGFQFFTGRFCSLCIDRERPGDYEATA